MDIGDNAAELDLSNLDALEYRIDLGKRRLNSRCMGLLEWHEAGWIVDLSRSPKCRDPWLLRPFAIEVTLLHRSLTEVLMKDEAQAILQRQTNGLFSAQTFLCGAWLTITVALSEKFSREEPFKSISSRPVPGTDTDSFGSLEMFLAVQVDRLLCVVSSSRDLTIEVTRHFMSSLGPIFRLLLQPFNPLIHSEVWRSPSGYSAYRLSNYLAISDPAFDVSLKVAVCFRLCALIRDLLKL